MSELELTLDDVEKTTRETLRVLAKLLQDLSDQKDVHGVQVMYTAQRPLHPQYQETVPGLPGHFTGLKQTGPKTVHIDIIDYTKDGFFIPAETRREDK